MKLQKLILFIFFVTVLSSCRLNPVNAVKENLQEAAAEKVAETIIEQATGAEIDINTDGESVEYSIQDEDGNTVSISGEVDTEIEVMEGMGVSIAVPNGLTNGYIQRINSGGEGEMITATFDAAGVDAVTFFEELDGALKEAGFIYQDPFETGLESPDPTAENFLPFTFYEHPNEINFSILWGDETVILSLAKMEA